MGPLRVAIVVCLAVSLQLPSLNGEEEWSQFYPLRLGDRREYVIDYKGKEIWGGVENIRSYREDGNEYFVMRNQKFDVEYHMCVNQKGAFLRRWRYPFPIFKFLHYTVKFEPPIPVMSFPLEVGKEWVYVGRGSVWFLGKNIAIA